MDKVAEKDISRARKSLDRFIKESKSCEDRKELHDLAVKIFGEDLAGSPEIAKRVCEAFNSNKSQYKFTYGTDETRDADFAILDPDKVAKDIKGKEQIKAVKKHASASFRPNFYANAPEKKAEPMTKVASAPTIPDASSYIEFDSRPEMIGVTISNVLDHDRDMILKLAYAVDDAKAEMDKAHSQIEREAGKLSKAAAAEVVSIGTNHYAGMFDAIRDAFPADLSLKKYASDPMVPATPIFQKVANYMEKAYIYNNKKALLKTAGEDLVQHLRTLAGQYNLTRYQMQKTAGVPAAMLAGALAPALRESLGLDEGKKAELYEKLLNTNVQNTLRALETKRNFYEVYADDYISTFPVDDVQIAYNHAIQKLPEKLRKHPSSATQLVRSWVIKMLSRGSVTSAEDAGDIYDAANNLRYEGSARNPYAELTVRA